MEREFYLPLSDPFKDGRLLSLDTLRSGRGCTGPRSRASAPVAGSGLPDPSPPGDYEAPARYYRPPDGIWEPVPEPEGPRSDQLACPVLLDTRRDRMVYL
jgi:hypothetical protein